mmetsp:Transcript_64071/g.119085  ORF Transcript_64071/g.119085 Transcript_64071/m.119085 type:complete len:270 (-) Transcript_64071:55-864(-)
MAGQDIMEAAAKSEPSSEVSLLHSEPPSQTDEEAKEQRRKRYEQRLRHAEEKASDSTRGHVRHLSCGLVGLGLLMMLRSAAWTLGIQPSAPAFMMNVMSAGIDIFALVIGVPLACTGPFGCCMKKACLGPVLTLLFAISAVDICALCTFFAYVAPQPMPAGEHTVLQKLELMCTTWQSILVASVCLEIVVCTSAWRLYQDLRLVGLYPPHNVAFRKGKVPARVSPMEIFCESEDVALLSDAGGKCCSTSEEGRVEVIHVQAHGRTGGEP